MEGGYYWYFGGGTDRISGSSFAPPTESGTSLFVCRSFEAPSKMASATLSLSLSLSLCASLAVNCRISQKSQNPLLSNTNVGFLSLSSHKLLLSSSVFASSRSPFPFLSKSSESEASVVEAEPDVAPETEVEPDVAPETEAEPNVGMETETLAQLDAPEPEAPAEPAPKREEVFAVVMVCFPFGVVLQLPCWHGACFLYLNQTNVLLP